MTPGLHLKRSDRYVRHARLRTDADAPRHTLASRVEEGLRLSTLPGENEGRVYYFRHMHVRGLSENASRREWLEAFQGELLELARCAVHGADPAARSAKAVFFTDVQEACTSLLSSIVQRLPTDEWYWRCVVGSQADSGDDARIVRIVETLSRSPASWLAVASVVFDSIELGDSRALLEQLPVARGRQWLGELGGDTAVRTDIAPTRFPKRTRAAVERAASLGLEDPRVLWLASLAVVLGNPQHLEHGVVVQRARRSLRALQSDAESGVARASSEHSDRSVESPSVIRLPALLDQPLHGIDEAAVEASTDTTPLRDAGKTGGTLPSQRFTGEVTQGAGLYFLLNALRQLKSVEDELSLPFLARFFQLAAALAGIENEDPILRWATLTLEEVGSPVDAAERLDERTLRLWLLRVRRWCWRNAKITVRTIVRRPGRVTLTRSDLDVFLALDLADVRIRRIGLDLDPGWVPWFGRVVHFHYLYEGELRA